MTTLRYSVQKIAGLRRVVADFGLVSFVRRHTDPLDADLPPAATVTDARAIAAAVRTEAALESAPCRLGLCADWLANNAPLIARFQRNPRLQALAAEVRWRLNQLRMALEAAGTLDPVYVERVQARCDQLERELSAALTRGGSKGKERPKRRKFTDEKLQEKLAGTDWQPGKAAIVARSLHVHPSTVRRRKKNARNVT